MWVLPAAAAFLAPASPAAAKGTGIASGVVYLAFLATTILTR